MTTARSFRPGIFGMMLLLILLAATAHATIVIPAPLQKLTKDSDTIVAGVVRETRSYWDQGRIYTDVIIDTMEYIKHPDASRPTTLIIKNLGGQIEDLRLDVDGVPQFAVDDEAVFFLHKTDDTYTIYGLHYGLVSVTTDPQTDTQRATGAVFQNRTTMGSQGEAQVINPLPPDGEKLSDFMTRVKGLLP